MDGKRKAIVGEIPGLRRYARALLRDADAADDLVQDCLERAFSRLDNWQTGTSPRRWLFTLMHNLFVDGVRARKRRSELVSGAAVDMRASVSAPEQNGMLDLRDVLDALQEISPERRTAILLVGVEGMSYAEAADVLDIPTGTLMSRVARGRQDLRDILDLARRRRILKAVE
ncbi:RNA polymerase sigma-70 factor, ECF subfamily [Nitratireductor aquibiodomus]|jgi:RNA polymerase sigma-70 factor, ECF subfamily|uniref:RNA polymerase sigma-70 factor, ECF subfamily n=1 Tax=Nitratireductor aquibiodomus TaxID=204799 RepID=A0A1H4NEV4_9HYPH|nr:sigma-70 family RNA polymerase sigma factor [Nitratireductor aquibiodomus]SEB93793.1 RNA polymerase sigma-70 factor, ECF subfamily [Nitratireductor aquibiodomus]